MTSGFPLQNKPRATKTHQQRRPETYLSIYLFKKMFSLSFTDGNDICKGKIDMEANTIKGDFSK